MPMNEDKDNVRVDLLKFRRKAYLSYPENSPERKNFLKTILKNELMLTESEVPASLINFAIEGKGVVFWNAVQKSIPWFGIAVLCNILFFILTHYHKTFAFFFLMFGAGCIGMTINYIYDYVLYYQNTKAAQKYLNDMNKYMNKISNEIKKLEGPR